MEVKIIQGEKVIMTSEVALPKSLSFESEGDFRIPRQLTLKKNDGLYAKMKEFVGRTMKLDVGEFITGQFAISLNENEDIVFDEKL
ncbi:hypothetical protein [Priestia megaterium]|uniref:hypothetical protein n=1 Tax=Priestia megaterium TaxID=1404 RepID=UPI00112C4B20|nr:hypothetical protein [Priestia megaterium]TPF18065.1 hypothetical protein CBE78_02220 [Priestia megaterium]TPF22172.1 hypothetical protein CBE79_04725 [Priestia megaterium]